MTRGEGWGATLFARVCKPKTPVEGTLCVQRAYAGNGAACLGGETLGRGGPTHRRPAPGVGERGDDGGRWRTRARARKGAFSSAIVPLAVCAVTLTP